MIRRSLRSVVAVGALLIAMPAAASEPATFRITNGLHLELAVPFGLKAEIDRSPGVPLSIQLEPEEPQSFRILLSAMPVGSDETKMGTENGIRSFVSDRGTALLPTAREEELKMFRVDGDHGIGYFYLLTDAAETLPEGEFRYVCQGVMLLEGAFVTATLLTDSPGQDRLVPFLEMLKTAATRQ